MKLSELFFKRTEEADNVSIDSCPKAQKVLSRYGFQLTCPEDEEEEKPSSDPYCENAKQIASKYGYSVVCPE